MTKNMANLILFITQDMSFPANLNPLVDAGEEHEVSEIKEKQGAAMKDEVFMLIRPVLSMALCG